MRMVYLASVYWIHGDDNIKINNICKYTFETPDVLYEIAPSTYSMYTMGSRCRKSNFRPIRNALRTIRLTIFEKANDGDRAKSPVLPYEQ
jgi:hypothetical protein